VALKVLSWAPDEISCVLSKVPPAGLHDVTVAPKEPKKTASMTEPDAFQVRLPEFDSVAPDHGAMGAEIIVNGRFFGVPKGKVYVGEKACKVLSWESAPGIIRFLLPKGLASGKTYELKVVNKVGQTSWRGQILID
jgi:hypothetical protein